MAYIAFASAKASPGVTTTIAAMAATWPDGRDLVVAELDPAGGDLAVRLDLAAEPGLVSLAAAGRRELERSTFLAHTQPLPFSAGGPDTQPDGDGHAGVRRVLVGPVAADQAGAALAALRGALPGVLSSLDADVLVDCGRLDAASAAHDVAIEADLLVMVARPVVAEVHHLAARLTTLRPRALSVLLVGERPYTVSEVADAVGAQPLGAVPADGRAAMALISGHPGGVRGLRRSRLLREAREVAVGLANWLPPTPAAPPATDGSRPRAPVSRPPAPVSPPSAPAPVSPPSGPTPAPPPSAPPTSAPAPTSVAPPPTPAAPRTVPGNGHAPDRHRPEPAPPPPADPPSPAAAGPKHFARGRRKDRR
jgi:hypothetical protein